MSKADSRRISAAAKQRYTRRYRRWTPQEDKLLTSMWAEHYSFRAIREAFRTRTANGIYQRVRDLGLPLGIPQGHESIASIAKRSGYSRQVLLRILKWAKVAVFALDRDHKNRRVGRPAEGDNTPRRPKQRRHYVETDAAEGAIQKWDSVAETVRAAAKRHRIKTNTLTRLMEKAGFREKAELGLGKSGHVQLRHHPKQFDAVVEKYRAEKQQRPSLAQAAKALGIHKLALLRAVKRFGPTRSTELRGKRWALSMAEYQEIWRKSLEARPGGSTPTPVSAEPAKL